MPASIPAPARRPWSAPSPPFEFETQLSGDGHYLFIRPDGILEPEAEYRVGSRASGRRTRDRAASTTRCGSAPSAHAGDAGATLRVGRRRVGALELSRLALPLPSLLPSVNQIGFDSYDLIAGTIARERSGRRRGRVLLWVIGGRPGKARRRPCPTPAAASPSRSSATTAATRWRSTRAGSDLQFSFGSVPLRSFDFRGRLDGDGGFAPGASLYGQVTCADVPNYSAQLRIAGVCNDTDTLAAYGTFLGERLRARRRQRAAARRASPASSG